MSHEAFFLIKPALNPEYTGHPPEENVLFNMNGDYEYLSEGYYRSLDAQIQGKVILPCLEEILDAYVTPLAMEKAKNNNISVPEYKITNDSIGIEPPVLVYPINPFSDRFELISTPDEISPKINGVTRLGKYAVLVQKLPDDDYRIDTIRCIMGKTLTKEYQDFAWKVFQVFRLPLMKVKVIVTSTKYLFSAISSLKFEQMTLKEKKILEGIGTWQD